MIKLKKETVLHRHTHKYAIIKEIDDIEYDVIVYVLPLNDAEIDRCSLPRRSEFDLTDYGKLCLDWYAHFTFDVRTGEPHLLNISSWETGRSPDFFAQGYMYVEASLMRLPDVNPHYSWYRSNQGRCCYVLRINPSRDLKPLIDEYAFKHMIRLSQLKERKPLDQLIARILAHTTYKGLEDKYLEILSEFKLLSAS